MFLLCLIVLLSFICGPKIFARANPAQFTCNASAAPDGYMVVGLGFCTGKTLAGGESSGTWIVRGCTY